MINYDPNSTPKASPEEMEEGLRLGLIPIHVVCNAGTTEKFEGVSFITFVTFIPRIGERITIEDGTRWEIQRVYHHVARQPGSRITSLVPNLYATKVSPD